MRRIKKKYKVYLFHACWTDLTCKLYISLFFFSWDFLALSSHFNTFFFSQSPGRRRNTQQQKKLLSLHMIAFSCVYRLKSTTFPLNSKRITQKKSFWWQWKNIHKSTLNHARNSLWVCLQSSSRNQFVDEKSNDSFGLFLYTNIEKITNYKHSHARFCFFLNSHVFLIFSCEIQIQNNLDKFWVNLLWYR